MKLLYARNKSYGRHNVLCRFLHLKIHVAHWLNPNCTLLPIEFELFYILVTFGLRCSEIPSFWLHLSVLLPCEWWVRRFLNHSNIEAVPNKRQPGGFSPKNKTNNKQTQRMRVKGQTRVPGHGRYFNRR